MSDYQFDPEESSLLYPFIRSLATNKDDFSKETIDEINLCFDELEKWFALFNKRENTDENGNYNPSFRCNWCIRNRSLTSEDYLLNDVEHTINDTILEDWIYEGIVAYEEVEVSHNHGPCPHSCYGPWDDVITYSTEWSFHEWDASKLHEILRKFKNSSRKEKYHFVYNYVQI